MSEDGARSAEENAMLIPRKSDRDSAIVVDFSGGSERDGGGSGHCSDSAPESDLKIK